jgi:hypothetical protein
MAIFPKSRYTLPFCEKKAQRLRFQSFFSLFVVARLNRRLMSRFTTNPRPQLPYRLHLEKLSLIGKSFSYSFAAWLLAFFDKEILWANTYQVGLTRELLEQQIVATCEQYDANLKEKQVLQNELKSSEKRELFKSSYLRKDKRIDEINQLNEEIKATQSSDGPVTIRLYTTYGPILHLPLTAYQDAAEKKNYQIVLVDSPEEADFLFLTDQMKDFYSIPVHQRVNQVPYESAIVRKVKKRIYCSS